MEGVFCFFDVYVDDVVVGVIVLGYLSVKVVCEGYEGFLEM